MLILDLQIFVCLFIYVHAANRPERECPSRRYVFERHPRKKLKLPQSDIKEVNVQSINFLNVCCILPNRQNYPILFSFHSIYTL